MPVKLAVGVFGVGLNLVWVGGYRLITKSKIKKHQKGALQ